MFKKLWMLCSLLECLIVVSPIALGVQRDIVSEISKKPGKIRFTGRLKDFGSVHRGQKLSHDFTFKNVGDGELVIQGVHASCGCTATEIDPGRVYQPGELGHLRVVFDTADFSGPVSKNLTIMSNDRRNSIRVLTVKAVVQNSLRVEPPLVDLKDIASDIVVHRRVEIDSIHGKPLEIKGSLHDPSFDVQVAALSEKKWAVDIYIRPQEPGILKDIIVLQTDLEHLPELTIPVVARVEGKIIHEPQYIEFGAVGDNRTKTKELKLAGNQYFRILDTAVAMEINGKAVNSQDYLTLDLKGDASDRHKMTIELHNRDHLVGAVHGDIEVFTDHPNHKTIRLDFFAFFQE
ncbi:DUF1573 domain-containing protein [Pseudobacteriovorax antillogorgiicola]|uniref:DUF1573 domain-containing protein n=1 Tax=Pseudobacteriovorax antillogorgiicola TaxID=1513793 RepID=A0A1Y6CNA1_9BACT|nr:DUF1573 domain-containing protein [Pseudobacteriovorax antillogorgiicola]TCS44397.1 uncharacterized protein DUF1573 [Pseudobacteriovorax antillogorgiicola]SMF79284.1 Protein of unknown function [Pseudobacteriovorax antillogorgiicola]